MKHYQMLYALVAVMNRVIVYAIPPLEQYMNASVAMNTTTQRRMNTMEWHTDIVIDIDIWAMVANTITTVHAIVICNKQQIDI